MQKVQQVVWWLRGRGNSALQWFRGGLLVDIARLCACNTEWLHGVQSRSESGFGEPVSEGLVSALSISRLGARVQQGLTPMKLSDSIWLGSLAPKVIVKWLNIS